MFLMQHLLPCRILPPLLFPLKYVDHLVYASIALINFLFHLTSVNFLVGSSQLSYTPSCLDVDPSLLFGSWVLNIYSTQTVTHSPNFYKTEVDTSISHVAHEMEKFTVPSFLCYFIFPLKYQEWQILTKRRAIRRKKMDR